MRIVPLLGLLTVAACENGEDGSPPPPERPTFTIVADAVPAVDPVVARFEVGRNTNGLALSANGERIFISNPFTTMWDIRTGASETSLGHAHWLATSRDGTQLLVFGRAPSAWLWDTNTLERRAVNNVPDGRSGAFSPDGSFLAVAGASLIPVWSVAADSSIALVGRPFSAHSLTVAVSLGGETVAAGYTDRMIRVFRISDGAQVGTLTGHAESVGTLAFSAGGSVLASGSTDGTVRLWDLASMTERRVLTIGSPVRELEVSPSGLVVASGSVDGALRLWSMPSGEELAGIRGESPQINAIAFSADGNRLAAVWQDGTLVVWDVEAALASYGPIGAVPPGTPFFPTGVVSTCHQDGVGFITGIVVDSLTNEPVEGALVDEAHGCRVLTDSAGRFMIAYVLPQDGHTVGAQKTGYDQSRTSTQIQSGDTVHVELRIAPIRPCDPASYPRLPRIETNGPEVLLRLTPAMEEVLERVLPGFRPARLDEFEGGMERSYRLSCYQAPSAAVGDFNGDGMDDLAAFGFVGDYQPEALALLSGPEGYRYVERDLHVTSPLTTTIWRIEPGLRLQSEDTTDVVLETHGFWEAVETEQRTPYHAQGAELVVFPSGAH